MSSKSGFLIIILGFLILRFTNGTEKKDTRVFDLSFGSTNVTVEIDVEKFAIEGSGFIISFEDSRKSKFTIDCLWWPLENAIEIDRCIVSFQPRPSTPFVDHYGGYSLKFNKDTKYVFSEHYLIFHVKDSDVYSVNFNIYDLIITFVGYTKKYTWDMKDYRPISSDLESEQIIERFEQYGGEYTSEKYSQESAKIYEPSQYNEEVDEAEYYDYGDDIKENTTNKEDETNKVKETLATDVHVENFENNGPTDEHADNEPLANNDADELHEIKKRKLVMLMRNILKMMDMQIYIHILIRLMIMKRMNFN
ncbi:hypothetical protein RF11_05783 [Thelohanellus kitauei]|uniref:Uncharacterized protein n=1 Tax=Thelohanellus kitauei TaxID=669202 RepID=A0A0C2IKX6_THEKT|nr:hypothetical protein RF11_05783 [Thelohanellus kitauei]